ncbi:MAG: PhzF family phenazine biosynthesis protein [Mesorhizobium sp.]
MRLQMFQVDAFTTRVFGGNPAAVLVLQDWLPDATMQLIAAENNLAETAFARPNGSGWDLRWFTPLMEVDFCGHATLATSHVLVSELGHSGELRFATRVGNITVVADGGSYRMDFPCFAPEPVDDGAINLREDVGCEFETSFRNFENIFVVLADEAAVRAFRPRLPELTRWGRRGLVVTARGDRHDFVSRYFAPGAGIAEDPVTGSTHATLTPYWAGVLGRTRLSAFQCSARGGELLCEMAGERVYVGGSAVTFMRAEITLD